MLDDRGPQTPTGQWCSALSLGPLVQAHGFITRMYRYCDGLRQRHGAAVFKAHPGLQSVVVTDHAAMEAVFSAPPEVFDRDAEQPGFGFMRLNRASMLSDATPALVCDARTHSAARALIDRIMALRHDVFQSACDTIITQGWPGLTERKPVDLGHALLEAASQVTFDWFFQLGPRDGEQYVQWLRACFGMRSDAFLARMVAELHPANRPARQVRAWSEQWQQQIVGSPIWSSYRPVFEELGFTSIEAAAHLLFAAAFNSAGAAYTTLLPALAHIHETPEVRRALAAELSGFQGGIDELDTLPYTDAVMYEAMRMNGRPLFYVRRALVPVTLHDRHGQAYRIQAGDRVVVVALLARRDDSVFADPDAFQPERYLRDPALRTKVYAFGPASDSPSPYGCAGARNRTAQKLWKALLLPLARTLDWQLSPRPQLSPDVMVGTTDAPLRLHWTTADHRTTGPAEVPLVASRPAGASNPTAPLDRG